MKHLIFSFFLISNFLFGQTVSIPPAEQNGAIYIGNDGKPKSKEMSLTTFRASSTTAKIVFINDAKKEGYFLRDVGNSTADNTGTIIVNSKGIRYKRLYDGAIKAGWFEISGDSHNGLSIQRAVNFAITSLSVDSNVVVSIGKGRSTVDGNYVTLAVPKWKKLTIQGEPGNIIDFYTPESGGAVFRTNPSAWETDSTYMFGAIELNGLNFYGGRNPAGAYLSESYGVRPIWIVNVQGIKIKNCSFRSIYGSALAVGWSRTVTIEGNNFEDVYARQPNSFGPGGIYGDATGDAISVYARCRNVAVSGNIAQLRNGQVGRCGISVDDRCKGFVVNNNVIQGYERGIHIEHSQNGVIDGNVVTRSSIAGLSAINHGVIWSNNVFDAEKSTHISILAAAGHFFALYDTLCTYRGNTVRNWTGQAGTYLAKFWGDDLIIEDNVFEPNRASAEVFGYGFNYRNTYRNNEFRGKAKLRIDYNFNPTVSGNIFWGGTIQGHNSEDAIVTGNLLRPDVGDNTGLGLVMYNMLRPYVANNTIISAVSYVIENGLCVDGVFEANTHLRKHSGATTGFFVDPAISATGAKKTAPDRYNVIRDYITPNTYWIGNTGTPTAY